MAAIHLKIYYNFMRSSDIKRYICGDFYGKNDQ